MTALPLGPTLADVLVAIDAACSDRCQRQDMASAVRTLAKWLNKAPQDVPANPRLIAIRLKSLSAAAVGVSPTRWNNVRSLLRAALTLVGPIMPGRSDVPLSEAWALLFDIVAQKRPERIRLSRVVRWLSAHQIAPSAVTTADLEQFHQELTQQALLKDPESTWRETAQAWNRAVKAVPGWPQLGIERQSRKEVYVLSWDRFPPSLKADVDGWLDRLACRAFADDGPTKPVSASTLKTREYQLRTFVSALVLRGRDPADLTDLSACLSYENFVEGLKFFIDRREGKSSSTVHAMAGMLKAVATHWVKADEKTLKKMATVVRKLAIDEVGMKEKNRVRLRPLEDPVQAQKFVMIPLSLKDQINRGKVPVHRVRLVAETAVAIEILLMTAIRIGNLAAIDIDRHLIRVGRIYHLVFPAAEVKNNVNLEFALSEDTTALIDWYITNFRQAPPGCRALFPGHTNPTKSVSALRGQISKAVKSMTGLDVHPHLFRHFGAQAFLSVNPAGHEVLRRVYGHKCMATTVNAYAGLQTASAAKHYAHTISRLREAAGRQRAP